MKRNRFFSKFKFLVLIPNDEHYKQVTITNFTVWKIPKQDLFIRLEKRMGNHTEEIMETVYTPMEFKKEFVELARPITTDGFTDLLLVTNIKDEEGHYVSLDKFGLDNIDDFMFGLEYRVE